MIKLDSVENVGKADKLKPCPFCGGKVTNYHTNHKDLNHRTYAFKCEKCEAIFYLPASSKYVSAENTEKELVELWNRRADNE